MTPSTLIDTDLMQLARDLSVTAEALQALGVRRNGTAWLIPERDAAGEVVGMAKRYDDGSKGFVAGGKRGLTFAHPLNAYAGSTMVDPVFVVEGASDTAAGLAMGLDVIGRPSATGGAQHLAELLKDRHVVIVAENDAPGQAGAKAIADKLLGVVRTLRIVSPSAEHKDLRAWYAAVGGITKAELIEIVADAPEYKAPAKAEPRRLSTPHLIRMSEVEPTEIQWLWPGRIPLGRITLLVGRPGDGKSFLTAYLAAAVSRGRDWIDGTPCPGGSVVLCSAEDDPADTIAPRLIAHDADRERVHLLTGVMTRDQDEEVERVFTLGDLDTLRQTLEQVPDCRLIVVDPIGSYLGGGTDAHRDNDVRAVLAPVAQLAAQYGAAVVVVAHTRKAAAANADDMVMGSRAFTGLARSSLHLLIDPDDMSKQRRLLLSGKNNLSERPAGLAFDIGPGMVDDRPCVRWIDGPVNITADEAINRETPRDDDGRTERDEAAEWLTQALAAGPRPANDIIEEAREAEGIAKRTLDRARKQVGVDAYRPANPGPWWWRLPSTQTERHNT